MKITDNIKKKAIIEALFDDQSRTILYSTTEKAKPVTEIIKETNIPMTSTYRKMSNEQRKSVENIFHYIVADVSLSKRKVSENQLKKWQNKNEYAIWVDGKSKENSILKNYKALMSDDIPMRNRRGELRNFGHKFYSDNRTSFNFTEEINRANVYLDKNVKSEINIKKSSLLSAKNCAVA